ncbi:unnamed protein product [Lactuca saligna]|uniref:Uncharacterized protein n=1 Tax=Lactuca saligna TaxID=75948 RepID=A0AA35ZFK6_LACSI|nr:unnamed protein product [Lactuca saligna]
MCQLPYVSSFAKASSLIHPVMKVAHRIIASLVIPREERSIISALELKILYDMAQSDDNLIPHYGSFLCNKLSCLSTSWSGKISCGDIVSLFAKSAPFRAPYPGIHQSLPGETYLITGIIESMRMFRVEDWNHNWTVGQNHDPRLLITPENRVSFPSGDPTISPTGKSHCISSPNAFPKRKKRKMERVPRVAGRTHKILLTGVVPTHPIRLDTYPITSNIWINSNQSIPASTLTIKISQA